LLLASLFRDLPCSLKRRSFTSAVLSSRIICELCDNEHVQHPFWSSSVKTVRIGLSRIIIIRLLSWQRSKLVAVAEKPTPSWERSLVTLQEHIERKGDTSDGASTATASDGTRYLHSTAELWQWIQEALGDTQTRTPLLDGEDLLELLRNGPGIRNPLRVTPEFLWNWDATTATTEDTESKEVESSEFTETENNSEAGTSEAAGLWNHCSGFSFCSFLSSDLI